MTLLRRNSISLYSGLLVLFCCILSPIWGQLQTVTQQVSTKNGANATRTTKGSAAPAIPLTADSLAVLDSIQKKDSVSMKKSKGINEIVDYESTDSLVFLAGGKGFLYNEAKVTYGDLNLNAGFVQMNMDSSLLFAIGKPDSTGKIIQDPVFKDKGGEYESKELKYNLKTGKGFIKQAITQQGEGFVVSGKTKKTSDDVMCMVNGKYTTCENHEHPHFYLDLSKAKVKPGKYIVSGPAHLVMEDVHLPLFLPFGYFPFKGDYSSGMLTPTYGDELTRGFYLKDGGYYFAFNDFVDLALTGEIYSKGSWGVNARSTYKVKYKYSGNFDASYLITVSSEKNLPDYSKSTNLSLKWSHSQDPKANPFSTLSGSVNFQTSGFARNNLNSYSNMQELSNNTTSSSINYTQRFPESPFNISTSMSISQRQKDSTLSISLPNLTLTMSSITPFKRKVAVGSERWYEKIRMSYSGSFANSIGSVKEKDLLHKSLIKDWRNAVRHSIPVSATFNALNYINITPSFNYTERWYSSSIDKYYDLQRDKVMNDTVWGFNRVWDYSMGVSASTKLYGFYTPIQKIFGSKVSTFRHVFTPSISYNYRPDFGQSKYGYYENSTYLDARGKEQNLRYSHFDQSMYGAPGTGKSGSVSFQVANNLEMKVNQVTDTAIVPKNISLIDNFSFGTSYNLAADSLNWSNISANIRIKITPTYTLNLSGSFDPYCYISDGGTGAIKTNTTQFAKYGIPGRLTGTSVSYSRTISNETFQKKEKKKSLEPGDEPDGDFKAEEKDVKVVDPEPYDPETSLYAPAKMPWSISMGYSLSYARADFNPKREDFNYRFTQVLSLNGNIAITPKWSMNASSSYDFKTQRLAYMNCSVTRDLHCWQMSGTFMPIGPYKMYNFSIRVKSSLLQDLKYEQRQNPNDNAIWGR